MTSTGRTRLLDRIERLGNALPEPAFIFVWLIGILVLVSVAADQFGAHAVHPLTGRTIHAESLLSEENLRRLLVDMPSTYTAFPPLGLILVVMLGAAVAERSGFFAALISRSVRRASPRLLTPAVFTVALLSHHASDAAYVVLVPLAAIVYAEAGRHPLAGIAVAYAGISGAFAANVVPGQFDALLLGITQSAAQLIMPDRPLNPLGNWWFTAGLGVLMLPVAWWVADRIVEPRISRVAVDGEAVLSLEPGGERPVVGSDGNVPRAQRAPASSDASASERAGLRRAALAATVVVAAFAALAWLPHYAPLRDDAGGPGTFVPFYKALIAGFFLLFVTCGWAYGSSTGAVRTHRDVVRMMLEGMRDTAPFLVIAFFAAHFIAMFAWSGLGPILAIRGAAWLQGTSLPAELLLVMMLGLSSVFDLLVGSSSAKWSVMAPIAVPLFALLGISPEMTTAAYRIGDSVFNIVTPVASNFVLVLVFCQRWVRGFGVGSLIAMMLPFSIAVALVGLTQVIVWLALGLPVGPGAPATIALPLP
jgi:aminobenzoyl-glutamate transport protein